MATLFDGGLERVASVLGIHLIWHERLFVPALVELPHDVLVVLLAARHFVDELHAVRASIGIAHFLSFFVLPTGILGAL